MIGVTTRYECQDRYPELFVLYAMSESSPQTVKISPLGMMSSTEPIPDWVTAVHEPEPTFGSKSITTVCPPDSVTAVRIAVQMNRGFFDTPMDVIVQARYLRRATVLGSGSASVHPELSRCYIALDAFRRPAGTWGFLDRGQWHANLEAAIAATRWQNAPTLWR